MWADNGLSALCENDTLLPIYSLLGTWYCEEVLFPGKSGAKIKKIEKKIVEKVLKSFATFPNLM